LRKSSKGTLATALAVSIALATAACTPAEPPRPDPTEVVTEYLEAIASGDATTARKLDATGIDDADRRWADLETLRTDAVLAGAQRIENVTVDPDTTRSVAAAGDPQDARQVTFTYELAGQQVSSALDVTWNAEDDEWQLADSLTMHLYVMAEVNAIEKALVSFDVPGASVRQPTDQEAATLNFLVYPAVYSVTADLDPALLTDPTAGVTQEVTVDLAAQPAAVFPVTQLP